MAETPRGPDRFDAQARELVAQHYGPALSRDSVPWLAAALRAAESSALERAAQFVESGGAADISLTTASLIAARIRALIPPAAAPAADYDPIAAPIPAGDMNGPHGQLRTLSDEEARRLSTFDAQLAKAGCSSAAETGKAQGAEARPFYKQCADALADEVAVLVQRKVIDSRSPAADALLDYRNPPRTPRSDRLAELETALRKICAIPLNSMAPDLAMRSIAEVALAARAAPPEEPTT